MPLFQVTIDGLSSFVEADNTNAALSLAGLIALLDELNTSQELCNLQRVKISGLMREWEQLKEERDKAREERDRVTLERIKVESTLNEARELTRAMAKELKSNDNGNYKRGDQSDD